MELIDILYEPYVIAIISALILTFIAYLFLKENSKKNKKDNETPQSFSKKLLITFIVSLLVFLGIIYGMKYLSNNNVNTMSGYGGGHSGGGNTISISDLSEKLNIADNDIDFGMMEA